MSNQIITHTTDVSLIRNFSIIAHIDHGKTTLTDVLLKLTGTISKESTEKRIMDSNPIEQEKGVTIKLAPVRMIHEHNGSSYQLNLIDTPGHVDFGYEVDRSLAACEGALLLIDATQGIQAQTLANYDKAHQHNLKIIPVINKIDLASAETEAAALECMETFGVNEGDIIYVSAKTGKNVEQILKAIIEQIPPPKKQETNDLRALIVTSIYDNHQGAIAYVRIVSGTLKQQSLHLIATNATFTPTEIGFFNPKRKAIEQLNEGEVGYIATGLKNINFLKIGDTITNSEIKKKVKPLSGFKEPQSVVFMEIFPIDNGDFKLLIDAMGKLALHDSALSYSSTHSTALGNGLRVGFLGIFHAEIIRERLKREFNLDLIATAPNVQYKIKKKNQEEIIINNPAEFPDPSLISQISEPQCSLTVFTPMQYTPTILKYTQSKRAKLVNSSSFGQRSKLDFTIPFSELITDFHDQLKSISSGFASMEYQLDNYQRVNAIKVDILVNHEVVEALSFISIKEDAEKRGRKLVKKLKEVVPRQMFEFPIQAAIGGKIIARETVKGFRKDVTAKLYGGDVTRRMKLLRKQSKGKKKLKQFGKVELNQEAFLAILKS